MKPDLSGQIAERMLISVYMKIRPVEAELLHSAQTDGRDEADGLAVL